MKRKGQAAMEFLMTYGWAILAAIIVIGVLAIYFRPSSLVTNQVVVTAPFYGVGVTINATSILVEAKNNGGETINVTSATLVFNSPSTAACVGVPLTERSININPGVAQVFHFTTNAAGTATPCGMTKGNTVNADITISYTGPGGSLPLQSTGTVSGKVA
ncbi:MAG: hypothetical protein KJ600_03730 [Nanoarchaeota archaeon]|nr:hypothetical protein [Nanoarchaeota archaeon]MBU1103638.1 hypothetical protein [Nanoarchaeota archaeon]